MEGGRVGGREGGGWGSKETAKLVLFVPIWSWTASELTGSQLSKFHFLGETVGAWEQL